MRTATILLLISVLVACDDKTDAAKVPETETATLTKTMVYAVDLNALFHDDLNDEDFSDVSPMTRQLIEDVLSGKVQAYHPMTDEPLTTDQVRSILQFTDTVWTLQPETGDQSIDIVERDHTTDFYGFTFKEQWSYDTAHCVIERRIVAIAPRIPVYASQGGELRGYTSAFWVKYE